MERQEILRTLNEKCERGNHPLVVIYSGRDDLGGDDVSSIEVRWCPNCGSVVIDRDFDGRTNPGAIMPMRIPKVPELLKDK